MIALRNGSAVSTPQGRGEAFAIQIEDGARPRLDRPPKRLKEGSGQDHVSRNLAEINELNRRRGVQVSLAYDMVSRRWLHC
jgi:hypothetical protein